MDGEFDYLERSGAESASSTWYRDEYLRKRSFGVPVGCSAGDLGTTRSGVRPGVRIGGQSLASADALPSTAGTTSIYTAAALATH